MVRHATRRTGKSGTSKQWVRWLARASTALAFFIFLSSSGASAQDGQPGYVDTTALNLRADAGTKSAIVGILLKYDAVTVLGRKTIGGSTWYQIEAGGGYTNGYVSARYIQFGDVPVGAVEEEILDYGPKETPTLVRGKFKYVGPRACAECHEDSTGDFPKGASTVWQHTVHSSAFQTLSKDYTLEIAKRKRGIDDPVNDWRCVKCHVTAFGADPSQLGPNYSHNDGVSCEVCHGPGGGYVDEDHGPDNPNREALGFRLLTNLTERREVCTSCHNARSPTYKPFNLREFSREIAHWVDPGDSFYYEDAVTEAKRRQKRVDTAQQKQVTAAVVAQAKPEDKARKAREAAEAKKREEERRAREAAAAKADASERARLQAEQKQADAQAAKADAERKAREAAERASAQKRLEAEQNSKRDAERKAAEVKLAAEAAEKAQRDAAASAARKKAEKQALAAAKSSSGVDSYLEDVDEVITLNTDGNKYNKVDFPHLAHASKQYLPDGKCQDCHHTQEGDDSPEACSSCHDVGGDADEESKKTRAVHSKNHGFPRSGDQEQTSCIGCHKSMNALLDAGKRTGDPAPTKCTLCHTRKK